MRVVGAHSFEEAHPLQRCWSCRFPRRRETKQLVVHVLRLHVPECGTTVIGQSVESSGTRKCASLR